VAGTCGPAITTPATMTSLPDLAAGGWRLRRESAPRWQEMLRKGVPGIERVRLVADESPVTELFNLAFASHEIVSDYTRVTLAWLALGGKRNLEKLLKAEQQRQRQRRRPES
jgi:hypothetical protein